MIAALPEARVRSLLENDIRGMKVKGASIMGLSLQ